MVQIRSRWIVLAAAFFTIALGASRANAQADPIEELFRKGVDLFEMGKYKEAREAFNQVLKLDPKAEQAMHLVEIAGHRAMIKLMVEPAIGPAPQVIWRLMALHKRRISRDPERIQALVEEVTNPETHPVIRWRIIHQLQQEIGQFAVPELSVHLMNAKDEERRTLARVAITRIGSRAVLPMIELLEHPNELMRQNAALILGDIQPHDYRAVAPLRRMWESEKEVARVKRFAERSLQIITRMLVGKTLDAREYYYHKANRYYREEPSVPLEAEEADGVLWHLSEGKKPELKWIQVPFYAWNELMAEQACYDLFEVDPAYTVSFPLFASVMAAQYAEVKDLIDVTLESPPGRPMKDEEVNEVRDRDQNLRGATLLIHSMGPKYLYRAIRKALSDGASGTNRDKYAGVLTVLIDAVKDVDPNGDFLPGGRAVRIRKSGRGPTSFISGNPDYDLGPTLEEGVDDSGDLTVNTAGDDVGPGDLNTGEDGRKKRGQPKKPAAKGQAPRRSEGSPLIHALDFPDKRVQYAAAFALAHMNSPKRFQGADKVVALLASAIGESGPLQVLLIEENNDVANNLRSKLEEFGYEVSLAADAREGLNRAVVFPPKDLIIVDNKLEGMSTIEVLQALRDNEITRFIPTAVLSEVAKHDDDMRKFPDFGILARDAVGADLKNPIEHLTSWTIMRALPLVNKLHAEEVSVAAANALLMIDPFRTWMLPADATQALITSLKRRSDDVRIPCAKALGQFRLRRGFETLVNVFNDKTNSLELRAAALKSIGQIAPDQAHKLFRKVEREDDDFLLKFLAAEGHGRDPRVLPETIIEFLNENRIEKKLKEE